MTFREVVKEDNVAHEDTWQTDKLNISTNTQRDWRQLEIDVMSVQVSMMKDFWLSCYITSFRLN